MGTQGVHLNGSHLQLQRAASCRTQELSKNDYFPLTKEEHSGGHVLKVLVTYYSDTGNTEKVAKAIYEEVSKKNKTDLKKVKETKVGDLDGYELVFIGSPSRGHLLASPVNAILNAIPPAPKYKLAGFITHMSPISEKHDGYEGCFASFERVSKQKQIDFRGVYDCQGVLAPRGRDFVKKSLNLSDAEWEKRVKEMEKHPSTEDLQKAKEFAKQVLAKI
jgi:flavodoxin